MTTFSPAQFWNSARGTRVLQHWFWRAVLFPYLLVRVGLFIAIYYAQIFPVMGGPNPPPWEFHIRRFLYVWANWDSAWYLSIIKNGYQLNGPIEAVQSNFAFYPLYPFLVKVISWPVYLLYPKDSVLIGTGVLLSNLFLLGALALLYRLIQLFFDDAAHAERTILYLLLFPAAFYFSTFYTEATFLFFAVAAFYLAKQQRWLLSGLMAAMVSLARPLGFLIAIPLAILYLESKAWKLRAIRADFLWLSLPPLALLGYMLSLYPITGDLLAIFHIQTAWQRSITDPITTLTHQPWREYSRAIYQLDRASLVLFFLLSLVALVKLPSFSLGVFALLILTPIFFSSQVASATRYCTVLFPVFILLGKFGKNELVHKIILVVFFTLQIILMAAWSRQYWVE